MKVIWRSGVVADGRRTVLRCFDAVAEVDGLEVCLEVAMRSVDEPELREIRVRSVDTGAAVEPGAVKRLNVERLVAQAVAVASSFMRHQGATAAGGSRFGSFPLAEAGAIRAQVGRRRDAPDPLEVADVCLVAQRRGRNMAVEVMDEFRVGKSTAYRYIAAARERGLLEEKTA